LRAETGRTRPGARLRPPPASRPRRPPSSRRRRPPPPRRRRPPGQPARLLLGASKDGPKLYREFHDLPDGDGSTAAQLKAAITEMLDGRTAYDPDYSSQWPASASVRSVTVSGTVATVDLAGATVNGYDPQGNRAACSSSSGRRPASRGRPG